MKLIEWLLKNIPQAIYSNNFIFTALAEGEYFTFIDNSNNDGQTLDAMYVLNHSGDKEVNPFIYRLVNVNQLTCDENIITGIYNVMDVNDVDAFINKIVKMIVYKFGNKWNTLYQMLYDNNPLNTESYNVTETPNIEVETNSNTQGDVYGFNSPNSVPDNKATIGSTTTQTGTRTTIFQGYKNNNIPEKILQEYEVLKKSFLEQIFLDVDTLLTLPIYQHDKP